MKSYASNILYGIFRTDTIRKSMVEETFLGTEWAIIFNVAKYGEIHQIEEPMLLRREQGDAWQGEFFLVKKWNKWGIGKIFPNYPLFIWCKKKLGFKVLVSNIDQMIIWSIQAELALIFDIIMMSLKKLK